MAKSRAAGSTNPVDSRGAASILLATESKAKRTADGVTIAPGGGGAARVVDFRCLGRSWFAQEPIEDPPPGSNIQGPGRPRYQDRSRYALARWSVATNSGALTRTVFVLKDRQLALLLDEVRPSRAAEARMRLMLAPGVVAQPLPEPRGVQLAAATTRDRLFAWPVGLPCPNYETERGAIAVRDGAIELTHHAAAAVCVPLLLSWNARRDRLPIHWRVLTVSEERRICPPEVAFAVRIGWRGEPYSLVIYQALAGTATRVFLGHQSGARLLIALFGPDGDLEPVVRLDDESPAAPA